MLRGRLWLGQKMQFDVMNRRDVGLHACQTLPATALADGHDSGDSGCDRMRGRCDAKQHAASRDRHDDWTRGRHLLRHRPALPHRASARQCRGATRAYGRVSGKSREFAQRELARERGLIEGGIFGARNISGVESLGTIFYEPLWWFRRRAIGGTGNESLRDRKVSIGPEGSGTRELSLELMKRSGMEGRFAQVLALAPRAAGEALLAGDIDVAFMMTSWESPVVQQLLADERIELSGFPHADAFVALYPFLTKVVVPRGVTDIGKDRPSTDVVLIATKASLAVRNNLHPAIQYLLLNAAREIHSGPSIFHHANQFPAPEAIDIPLSGEAQRFYKSGLPFLNDYFPGGADRQADHPVIPILGVLYPMMRFLPRFYDWLMRSKILQMYGELRLLEGEMANARGRERHSSEMIARLDRLEEQANHAKVPVAYASMLYSLRNHIDMVREALKKHADKVD